LIACTDLEPVIVDALQQAQASFAILPAASVDLDDADLHQFDALVLSIGDNPSASDWLRPEVLRNLTRPLLLAGPPEAIYSRETLQCLADEVILSPFSADEFLFRLHRIVLVKSLVSAKSVDGESAVPSGKPVILVADDDLSIVNYLDIVLETLDVEVYFVSDGRAALAAARRLLPELLILDVRLPLMNGLEVLRRLRKDPVTRHLTAVMLTAFADPADKRRGLDLGVVEYILKPFDHNALLRTLRPLIRGAEVNEAASSGRR
jgi:CheY-like chemotaxis protein